MSRFLYLIRHAQAANGVSFSSDMARTLTQQGERDALALGAKLKSSNSNINLILASPAVRASSTADIVSKQIEIEQSQVQIEPCLYAENKIEILKLINSLKDSITAVMLVGHYPTIVELHNYLSGNKSIASMDTAQLCALRFDSSWVEITEASGFHEFSFLPEPINL